MKKRITKKDLELENEQLKKQIEILTAAIGELTKASLKIWWQQPQMPVYIPAPIPQTPINPSPFLPWNDHQIICGQGKSFNCVLQPDAMAAALNQLAAQ